MARRRLTDRTLRSLSTSKESEEFYDETERAFGVRVMKSGRKTFFVRFRAPGSSSLRRITLGHYPEIGLAEARQRARAARVAAVQQACTAPWQVPVYPGVYPGAYGPAAGRPSSGMTLSELAAEYIERYAKVRKRTWKEDRRVLNKEILSRWPDRVADTVIPPEVQQVIDEISARAPTSARRDLAIIRKMFTWAKKRGLIATNPCLGVETTAPKRPKRPPLTDEQLRQLWQATEEDSSRQLQGLVKLLTLTGQRGREVRHLRLSDIQDGVWYLPGEFCKSGRGHGVPLSDPTLRVIAETPRVPETITAEAREAGRDWLFASPRKPALARSKSFLVAGVRRIRERCGGFHWSAHSLRHLAATRMAEGGTPRFIIARVLNHADSSVTSIYDQYSYLSEKRAALAAWGQRVMEIVSDEERREPEEPQTEAAPMERLSASTAEAGSSASA